MLRVQNLPANGKLVLLHHFEVKQVVDDAEQDGERAARCLQVLDALLVANHGNDELDEHERRGERRAELMLDHRGVTLHVARLTLLPDHLALQSHDLYVLGHVLKIDSSRRLLVIFNVLNANARELFLCVLQRFPIQTILQWHDLKEAQVLLALSLQHLLVLVLRQFHNLAQRQ